MGEDSFQIEVLVFMVIIAIYILASYFIEKYRVPFLHESTIAIVLGLFTAVVLQFALGKRIAFSNQILFALLLPPIIFAVGYHIKKLYFFQSFGLISILGVLSSLITIGLFICLLSSLSYILTLPLSPRDIILLSIILSSIDPITSLPTIKDNHPRLNAILSGQSILNSAVVIILFGIISEMKEEIQEEEDQVVLNILVLFGYQFLCSIFIGIVFGMVLSFIFKRIQSFWHEPIRQTSLILLNGYTVYLFGQIIGLSGIISLFTTAIVFSIYGFSNLSLQARHGTSLSFQTVKFIFQAFIFSYIGVQFINIQKQTSGFIISLIIILCIPIIRIISIFFIPTCYKIIKRNTPLTNNEFKMLWYSGLTRGIIAFALSLQIESINRSLMINISLFVVMFSTIFCSTFLKTFIDKIGLSQIELMKVGGRQEQKIFELVPSTKYSVIGGGQSEQNKQSQKFKSFQQKFIKPLFVKSVQNKKVIEDNGGIKVYLQGDSR